MRKMGIGLGVGINRSNYAQGIFGAYATRVVADGGVVEGGSCVDAVSSLLQSASLLLIPSGYKGGKLYAEIPTNGNGDLTWTRGSDAFRTNASGLIQRVPWNLLQYSEDFSNAYWSKTGSSINANSTNAPNSTLTADSLIEDSSTGLHFTTATITVITNTTYTATIYVKANTRTKGRFRLNDTGGQAATDGNFDLSAGTISFGTIEDVGSGWYRLSLSRLMGSTSASLVVFLADSSGTISYTGNGTSGIYIWGAQLVEGTTAQTYLPTTDRLNFPRLSYMYGSCPSVLLEPQRTNLALNSEDFTNSSWASGISTSLTANTTTSPSGTTTADTAVFNATTGYLRALQNSGITNGATYTLSFYAKSSATSGASNVRLTVNNTATWTGAASTKVALTSSWQRITLIWTSNGTQANFIIGAQDSTGSLDSTCYGNVDLWGAQLELGAYPTTYIPTTSATATRVADSASKTGISSLIGQTEGTVFLDFIFKASDSNVGGQIGISDSAKANRVILWNNSSFNSLAIQLKANNSNAIAVSLGTFVDGTRYKIAIAYKSGDTVVYVNGTQTITNSASFTFSSSLTDFILGGYETTMASGHQFCFKTALFTSRLSNSDLATLTT